MSNPAWSPLNAIRIGPVLYPPAILCTMRVTAQCALTAIFAVLAVAAASSQGTRPDASQQPTFRVAVDLVTTDAIPRDSRTDQFIADLKTEDFEIYEDGVKQSIVSLVLTHGGRVFNVQAPPAAPAQEGII